MVLQRRRFLILAGGGAVGLGGAALARQGFQPSHTAPAAPAPNLLRKRGLYEPPRGDMRIVVISDLNSQYGSTDYEPEVDLAIALMPGWDPDLVLCGGDMVAGQSSSLTRAQMEAMWSAFDAHVAAPLRRAGYPYGFTLGNHDASNARDASGAALFGDERAVAAAYWRDPDHDPGLKFVDRAGFPFYYSFMEKDIFFLTWDASTAKVPSDQIAWAESSLASDVAQNAKLRIMMGHLPLYGFTVGRDFPGEYLENADELRSLMERYQVHTYVSGHDHAYYPGYRDPLQLLHAGVLGSGPRPYLTGFPKPFKALTVMDVDLRQGNTAYTTYDMGSLELVDQGQLPKLIVGPNGYILRRDIAWEDLTPREQATPYVPSY